MALGGCGGDGGIASSSCLCPGSPHLSSHPSLSPSIPSTSVPPPAPTIAVLLPGSHCTGHKSVAGFGGVGWMQAVVGWDGCRRWGAVETLPCLPSRHQPSPGSVRLSCQPRRPHPGPWCHPRPAGSTRESAMPARDSEGVVHTPTGSRMPPQATPSCLRPPAFM